MSTASQHLDLGRACLKRGEYVDALTHFRAVLDRFDPAHVEALFLAGKTEYLMGREDDARASWKQALALDPNHAEVKAALGHLPREPDPDAPLTVDPYETPAVMPPAVPVHDIERTLAHLGTTSRAQPLDPPPRVRPAAPEEEDEPRPGLWARLPHPVRSTLALLVALLAALVTYPLLGGLLQSNSFRIPWGNMWGLFWLLPPLFMLLITVNLAFLWAATVTLAVQEVTFPKILATYVSIFIFQAGGALLILFLMCWGPVGYIAAMLVACYVMLIRPAEFISVGFEIGIERAVGVWIVIYMLDVVLWRLALVA